MNDSLMCGSRGILMEQTKGQFRKELIRIGEYTFPGEPERKISITAQRLNNWVKAYRESGVKVWVPLGHTRDPQQNAGWVIDMFIEDDALLAIIEITEQDVLEKLRNGSIADVSIGVEYDFVDHQGANWAEIIRHVALTVDPHIRHQEGFLEVVGEPSQAQPEPPQLDNEKSADAENEPIQLESSPQQVTPTDTPAQPTCSCQTSPETERRPILFERQQELQRKEVEQEVDDWIRLGKITPAVKTRVVQLLQATEGQYVHFEGGNTNLANLFRSIMADMPVLELASARRCRLHLHKPPSPQVGANEQELLKKLGISEEVYLKYRT